MAKKSPAPPTAFTSYALSDQGIRSNNEDLVHHDDDRGIYFVVDGMGGHAAGEHAARIAGERLRGRLERPSGTAQQRIREAIALANNAIYEAAEKNPEWTGMACVLSVAILNDGIATIGHVGDSRLYKIRGTTIEKITRDHSPVGELEDSGQLNEERAMSHPRRNEVFRDVGSSPRDPNEPDFIDIYEIPVEPDSALLLCSDGLTDAVPRADIQRILRDHAKRPDLAVEALIECAKKMHSKDNISVVLVRGPAFNAKTVSKSSAITTTAEPARTIVQVVEKRTPVWRLLALLLLGLIAGGGAVYLWLAPKPKTEPSPSTAAHAPAILKADPRTLTTTLQQAAEGDTIELAPEVYDQPVSIEKSNLTLNGSGSLLQEPIIVTHAAGVQMRNLRVAGMRIIDSQVTMHNVHVLSADGPGIEATGTTTLNMDASSVRDCDGPGLLLKGSIAVNLRFTAIVGNGSGIVNESTAPLALLGCTIANNKGPAITQADLPDPAMLSHNFFTLDGRRGRLDDVKVLRKKAKK